MVTGGVDPFYRSRATSAALILLGSLRFFTRGEGNDLYRDPGAPTCCSSQACTDHHWPCTLRSACGGSEKGVRLLFKWQRCPPRLTLFLPTSRHPYVPTQRKKGNRCPGHVLSMVSHSSVNASAQICVSVAEYSAASFIYKVMRWLSGSYGNKSSLGTERMSGATDREVSGRCSLCLEVGDARCFWASAKGHDSAWMIARGCRGYKSGSRARVLKPGGGPTSLFAT